MEVIMDFLFNYMSVKINERLIIGIMWNLPDWRALSDLSNYKNYLSIHGFRDSVPVRKLQDCLLGYAKISSKTSCFGGGFQGEAVYITFL